MTTAGAGFGRGVEWALRIALLVGTAAAIALLFSPERRTSELGEPGSLVEAPRVARIAFVVPKDTATLRRERDAVAQAVAPVFDWDSTSAAATIATLRAWNAGVDSILRTTPPGMDPRAGLVNWFRRAGIPPSIGTLEVLLQPRRRASLLAATESAVQELSPGGVLLQANVPEDVRVLRVRGGPEGDRLVPADALLSATALRRRAAERLPEGSSPAELELQSLLLIRYLRPTLVENAGETEAARQRARAAVDPIELRVQRGDTLVAEGSRLGNREIRRLRLEREALVARGLARPLKDPWILLLGRFLYNALVLSLIGVMIWFRGRREFGDLRALALIALLVLSVFVGAVGVVRGGFPLEAIPIPFAIVVTAVLGGARLALPLALILALLLGGQAPFVGMAAPFGAALGGAGAALGVRTAKRRTQVWRPIIMITVGYAAVALTLTLLGLGDSSAALRSVRWGAINAVISTFLAIGFLPVFETWVRVTTQQTLLELSDTNRPLLRRLQMEANGTFHHAINVANLAEAACQAIGASGLLARVGALYHDVGKLAKPQYFVENQPTGRNPHDKLKPATSAAIIRSHVTEGLRLADRAKLPGAVRRFIAEHHGTQRISFFFDQAPPGSDPSDYSYPGPKPQTRESGVLMLADSVESAAHVLTDPTPPRLRDLVERITAGKIAAGQFDECPLTLEDIATVKEQLARVLAGMYHHRIDYPAAPADPADRAPAAAAPGAPA